MAKNTDNFYLAFEDRHRGPREQIKSRLQVYRPFVEPLMLTYAAPAAIDLGCGRGEWLELVSELGFEGIGVDLNEAMLVACHDRGLKVECKEAIAYLKSLPDANVAIVSAFHVAEHIAFDELQNLVQEALRVLLPGGLLILETPNPENIVVAGSNFYLDPTHQRPIPPLLLSYLPEHYGFERVKILRLQEAVGLAESNTLTLLDVLGGVSPDYAVVARKSGPEDILATTESAFAADYGISLNTLAAKYEQQRKTMEQELQARVELADVKALLAEANNRVQLAEAKAHYAELQAQQDAMRAAQAETRATHTEAQRLEQLQKLAQLREEHNALLGTNHIHWVQANERQAQLDALIKSRSWQATAAFQKVNHIFSHQLKQSLRNAAMRVKPLILRSPILTRITKGMLHRSLWLRSVATKLRGAESISYSARTFDDLVSIKVMDAMSQSIADGDTSQSVIFLQVPHAR